MNTVDGPGSAVVTYDDHVGVSKRRRRGTGVLTLMAIPSLMIVCLFGAPFVMLTVEALSSRGVMGSLAVVTDPLFTRALARTLIVTTLVTLFTWPCGLAYALALMISKRVVRTFLFCILLLSFWVSLLIRTFGWVILLEPNGALDFILRWLHIINGNMGLYDTTAGMLPGMIHIMLPFMVLPVYASLRQIDPQHVRAAQSLGSSPLFTLRKVVIPQLKPGVTSGLILVFVLSIGFFVTPALLGGPSNLVIATLISNEFNSAAHFGVASAMAAVLLIVVLIIYLLADRLFRVSDTWGGM